MGTVHETTSGYLPESDGSAEIFNKTLLEMARTMLVNCQASQPNLWAEAINISWFLRKCLVTESWLKNRTPNEEIHQKNQTWDESFGTIVLFIDQWKNEKDKFDSQADKWLVIGYSKGDAYRIVLSDGESIIESKDARMQENEMLDELRKNFFEFSFPETSVFLIPKVLTTGHPRQCSNRWELGGIIPIQLQNCLLQNMGMKRNQQLNSPDVF